mmetsp:Transcript_17289/g.37574  ORF Transcript_17289/g.37574 Transcript_17289/m.37574 type:complete len:437 (-) Transcript_17289:258-1568(-)
MDRDWSRMADAKVYVSSYSDYSVLAHLPHGTESDGLYGFRLNTKTTELRPMPLHVATNANGASSRVERDANPNPAFMRIYGNELHVVNERIDANGELFVYSVDERTGAIQLKSRADAAGRSTCYSHKDSSGNWVLLINYWDATISVIELLPNGKLGNLADVHRRPGFEYCQREGPDRGEHLRHRQGWSHTHCIVPAPGTRKDTACALYFVPDLGENCIHQLVLNRDNGTLTHAGMLELAEGHGPRHLVFHSNGMLGFVVNELDSTVDVLDFDAERASLLVAKGGADFDENNERYVCLRVVQTISTLPDGFHGKSHCAEIKVGPDGRFLYVANRFSDTLAVFRINVDASGEDGDEILRRVEVVSSEGRTPRHFSFDPTGQLMVVANTDNDMVCIFAVNPVDGTLLFTGRKYRVPSPNYVLVVPEAHYLPAPQSSVGA